MVGIFRYLLCLCCESGQALVWLVDAHQRVHSLDRNDNYGGCMWLEHSLSNVPRWAGDCIALDALLLIHSKNELTSGFEVLCFPCRALHKHGGLSLGMSPSRHTSPRAPLPLPFFFFPPPLSASPVHFHNRRCLFSDGRDCVSEEKATLWSPPPFYPAPSNTASSSLALHFNRKKKKIMYFPPVFLWQLHSAYSHTFRQGERSCA